MTFAIVLATVLSPVALSSEIVAAPCRDGIVVVADKLARKPRGNVDEKFEKICAAGTHCVVGTTGHLDIKHFLDIGGNYSAQAQTVKLLREEFKRDNSIEATKLMLQKVTESEITKILNSFDAQIRQKFVGATFTQLVINYDSKKTQYEGLHLNCSLDSMYSQPKVEIHSIESDQLANAHIQAIGMESQSSLSTMPEVANSDWGSKFFVSHPSAGEISKSEAVDAAVRIVDIVHREYPDQVGERVDVMLVGKSGVDYEYKDVPAEQILSKSNRVPTDILIPVVGLILVGWVCISAFIRGKRNSKRKVASPPESKQADSSGKRESTTKRMPPKPKKY